MREGRDVKRDTRSSFLQVGDGCYKSTDPMLEQRRLIIAMAALLVAGGLALWRCGKEPRQYDGGNPGELPALDRGAALPSKSEERHPSKGRTREESAAALAKIKFDLGDIRSDGLRGPVDGLVSVSYEFCVPKDEKTLAEVKKVAPGVTIHAGSRGRIGCTEDQVLCIGSTSGENWREVLLGIAGLGYVAEIRECHFE